MIVYTIRFYGSLRKYSSILHFSNFTSSNAYIRNEMKNIGDLSYYYKGIVIEYIRAVIKVLQYINDYLQEEKLYLKTIRKVSADNKHVFQICNSHYY